MDARAPGRRGAQVTRCSVTTGFFVLGRCGEAAVTACPQCARPACAAHAGPDGLCPSCAAARRYGRRDPHDPSWTVIYRRSYYERSSRDYRDPLWYTTFDEYDRGAFNPGDDWAHGGDWDHDDDAGFVDS